MTRELIAQAEAALSALEWHYHQGYADQMTDIPRKRDAKIIRELKTALRAQAEQPAEQGEPVASLYVGSEWGEELQDWEIEANQKVCERLNEQHAGNPATITLYARPDPRVAELEALLVDIDQAIGFMPKYLRERIAAALGEG